mmetsp:Transcript_12584/g.29473  ORF Transcript_12584/g.29473 Transcript_12584/m.29473 type:complete len:84 (+) Transcript_12584:1410-1661(+)
MVSLGLLFLSVNRSASHSTPARDKKLVGSSRSRTSGSSTSAAQRATRLRSPPDKFDSDWSCKWWILSFVAISSALVKTSHPPR